MKLMVKDGKYEYVADAHFDSFIMQGYAVADGVPLKPKEEIDALKAENAQLKAELEVYKEQVFNMLKPIEGPGSAPVEEAPAPVAEPEAAPVEEAPAAEEKPKKSKKAKSE